MLLLWILLSDVTFGAIKNPIPARTQRDLCILFLSEQLEIQGVQMSLWDNQTRETVGGVLAKVCPDDGGAEVVQYLQIKKELDSGNLSFFQKMAKSYESIQIALGLQAREQAHLKQYGPECQSEKLDRKVDEIIAWYEFCKDPEVKQVFDREEKNMQNLRQETEKQGWKS